MAGSFVEKSCSLLARFQLAQILHLTKVNQKQKITFRLEVQLKKFILHSEGQKYALA